MSPASFGVAPAFASLVAFANKYKQSVVQADGIAPGFRATRASVVQSFVPWSSPLEDYLDYPYTDAQGLVTTGMGNMIDSVAPGQKMGVNCGHGTSTPCGQSTPTAAARALPWNGDIAADWARLKAAWPKVQSTACKSITSARLSTAAVQALIASAMRANETAILAFMPNFASIPADGQLAAHSMSWAMGTGGLASYKSLISAVNAGDYATAAAQSHMRGVGIDMRNLGNQLLWLNAAAAKSLGANPDHLYYLDGLTQLAQGGLQAQARLASNAIQWGHGESRKATKVIADTVQAHPVASAAIAIGAIGVLIAILNSK
jgi:GH24 family phage-related lysozyme (muramidase)